MEQENTKQLNQIAEALNDIASSMKRNPQEERYHSETHCGSCGRFVGTETRCPYCQAETNKRLSIRIFKIISVAISTVGLLMLLFYARNVQTPEVSIKELGPLSNFAHVRVVGYAAQDARRSNWGTVSFTLHQYVDKDGKIVADKTRFPNSEVLELRVNAYKKIAQEITDDMLPKRGDLVDVQGQVRVQQREVSMLVNAPEHLVIAESNSYTPLSWERTGSNAPLKPLPPDSINSYMKKQTVKVLGKVKEAKKVENDCVIIELELLSGKDETLPVFVPQFSKKSLQMPKVGDSLECVGIVEEYAGKLEIKVKDHSSFIVKPNKN